MNLKQNVAQAAMAAGLGLSALALAAGAGTASADPPQPCWQQQNCQGDQRGAGPQYNPGYGGDHHQWGIPAQPDQWHPDQGWDQRTWDQRGVDDGRYDHQSFNWQGQRAEPYWDRDRGLWGFWFLGMWIPL